ncbi:MULTISPECIES: MlaD family protein [Nocardia]|uniref:MlaD family protein n=1 Tax=Nocardia TaxID=1817 RepID=UPI0007A3E9C9|nr:MULTISPECIES: MlaD family protein [Nocardia]OBF87039.1 mammalian cell entry protein [Mycobacterium sp. 852002-51759_SCH5129042]MBF6276644.1 MCE family protein [Nocardia nova]MDN2495606.1 MCE family protein [Nocardia nova]OBA45178.1 mammalian cell entry protein [Nocardia sp. 852002-51101_SCH5132738]OBB47556.1 mammalian cell entry protein [Nocardia sp. 852002-51244_SCH5132740]
MRWGALTSLGGIVAITVLGASYLTFGVVRADPFADYNRTTMVLTDSGGLGVGSPVLLTGLEVGRVTAVRHTAAGVEVGMRLAADKRVPADSTVTIEHLSALGEPYVEFRPTSGNGPYLHDGQRLETSNVRMPLSIPDVARLVTKTMNQLDPEVVGSLVATASSALNGTDAAIPNLTRSGDLLAAAIMSRSPRIADLLNSFQAAAADIEWAGPATSTAAPAFVQFTHALNDLVAAVGRMVDARPAESYTEGNGLAPFLAKLTDRLAQLGPELKSLGPALAPLAAATTDSAPRIDISDLITQALDDVGTDGTVRVRINVK